MLESNDKAKIQRIVSKIISGEFDVALGNS
jgi:hypothetical protein